MNIRIYKKYFLTNLEKEYPQTEAETFFYWLTESYLNMNRLQISMNPNLELNPFQKKQFDQALKRLQNHEPIQYIIGTCEFYGMNFLVNPSVLIPRPETEELVNWMLEETDKFSKPSILDIGTGSGCIAISLAKNLLKAEVFALDISETALETAKKNAVLNEVCIHFIQENILTLEKFSQKIDLLVSNPPYVREQEKNEMRPNVLDFEPKTALFVKDDDALVFYRKIAEFAKSNLSEKGCGFVEINQYLGKETAEIFQNESFQTELRKDLFGNDRVLKFWK